MENSLKKEHKIILGIICSIVGLGLILVDYFLGTDWKKFLVYFINILGSIILFIGFAFTASITLYLPVYFCN